jgi:polyisoprenoid-binding protein YceI
MRFPVRRCCAASAALASMFAFAAQAADAPASRNVRSPDPALVQSGTYVDDSEHTRALWMVSHHGYSHFFGLFPKVDATLTLDAQHPEKSAVTATIDLNVLGTMVQPETANESFTKILKSDEVFDVAKYPTVTFKSTKVTPTGKNKATVTGDLTLHGVTKPAVMDVTFNQSGEGPTPGYRIGFDGTMTVHRLDWGVGATMPGQIGPDVTVTIEGEFIRPKAGTP